MTIYASNAERPIAGNEYLPDSMEARGKIRPMPPLAPNIRNGEGLLVAAGLPGFEWTFNTLTQTELDWWCDLIGYVPSSTAPIFSKRFIESTLPAARLWMQNGTIVDFAVAVVDIPLWETYKNGYYHNAIVRFSSLVPSNV